MTSDRPDDPDYMAQGIETLTKCVTSSKRQRRMEERPAPPRVLKEHNTMFDLTGTSELREKKGSHTFGSSSDLHKVSIATYAQPCRHVSVVERLLNGRCAAGLTWYWPANALA